eukprot:scaffold232220_cov36-Tisochrysis_lutea.AAC.2
MLLLLLLSHLSLSWAAAPRLPRAVQRSLILSAAQPAALEHPASRFADWPVWDRPPAEYELIVSTFVEVATAVPLDAAAEEGDGWRRWADGGFAAHLLVSRKLSRKTYEIALQGLLELVVRVQEHYPELYAVLKVRATGVVACY